MKRHWLVHKARTKTAHGFMENTQYKFGRTVFIQVMFWKVFLLYQEYSGDKSFQEVISRGLKFYIDKFFLNDGTPKYYDNKTYPIDIHCPGQLFVTLRKLGQTNKHNKIIEKVLKWTINNMQDKKAGFFIIKRKGFIE